VASHPEQPVSLAPAVRAAPQRALTSRDK
jgi:hypothetical protein